MILPDLIERDMRVVFCGTAVGRKSAQAGAYYAGPGNSFWATLHEIGLTPREFRPSEFSELPRYGIGLTDLCKVSSGSDVEVGTGEFDVERLVATLERHAPAWIAFNGKTAAKAALGRPVEYGRQSDRLAQSRVFVLPSTSGAARGYWDARFWHQLAEAVR
jgi:TDG/mug DNA glycosylase family protein